MPPWRVQPIETWLCQPVANIRIIHGDRIPQIKNTKQGMLVAHRSVNFPIAIFRTCCLAVSAGGKTKMLSESFGTRRNHTKPSEDQCYGSPCQPATHSTNTWLCQPATHNTSTWLCQPAKHNTNTWLCQPVAHKHESESKVWIDGRLDGYVDGLMEMDRWIDGRTDDKKTCCRNHTAIEYTNIRQSNTPT